MSFNTDYTPSRPPNRWRVWIGRGLIAFGIGAILQRVISHG